MCLEGWGICIAFDWSGYSSLENIFGAGKSVEPEIQEVKLINLVEDSSVKGREQTNKDWKCVQHFK